MPNNSKKWTLETLFPPLFVGFLFLLNLLPLIAPVLSFFGERKVSGFIYWLYSFACHQKSSRSFFICDNQCGWCARCTFLWFSTFVTAASVFYLPQMRQFKGISLKTAILLGLPLALDGGIQLIGTFYSVIYKVTPFYESVNSLRAITGILFGLAVGLYLFPRLRDELRSQ